ncbi:MAG: hypothetical protein IPJ98_04625 [Bryobacterales bacterium]|nr:hypothetical protein [Bryobacterales bacterium]
MRLRAVLLAVTALQAESVIFSPADRSVVNGEVRVVARQEGRAELMVDGKVVAAESPHAGVLTAVLKLGPGGHEIAVEGGAKVKVHVGEGAPAGWLKFREHPPGATACTTCHAVKNGEWAFAKASLVGVCFACHDKAAFPKTHTHEAGIVPDCQLCHSPHGSAAAKHLKMTKEAACKLCHN